MKYSVAQINTIVGDIEGNAAKLCERIAQGKASGVDLVIFPELALTGYPPRDLVEISSFVEANLAALQRVARAAVGIGAVVGYVAKNPSGRGRGVHNSAALVADGQILHTQHKTLLPNYDVFDEVRYFEPARRHDVVTFRGVTIGLSICEDCWSPYAFRGGRRLYSINPMARLKSAGAELVINLSASPFEVGKSAIRRGLIAQAAKRFGYPVLCANLVGGNDDLVFDGHSFATNAQGEVVRSAQSFVEDTFVITTEQLRNDPGIIVDEASTIQQVHAALVLGLRDYMTKCGFHHVVIGLSGGIDSAVVAALAAEALGAGAVRGIAMPSPYSSEASVRDAEVLAQTLGIAFDVRPIHEVYGVYRKLLDGRSPDAAPDLADENIQARIRGTILMACSNRTGSIVLSTGNKSELAVGYCTIYGDMVGGLAVLSDVPKTMVYDVARWINRDRIVIPPTILAKPPSAELRPNQTDQETLPPYEVLDPILKAYIEDHQSAEAIIAGGYPAEIVTEIIRRVNHNEYKRRQAAPGLKITSKAFGMGRRFPIACQVKP